MNKYIFLLACLVGMAACSDHKDLYDPNASQENKKEDYNKNFPVDIDSNQDWNMFAVTKVNVTVNEDWGETYVVKVYTDNPLVANSGAMLLAKGEVKNGNTFSADVELPKGLAGIFVSRTAKDKSFIVKFGSLEEEEINVVFGINDSRGRAVDDNFSSGGGVDLESMKQSAPYTNSEIENILGSCADFKEGKLDGLSGNYRVESDYTLPSSIQGNSIIIVPKGVTLNALSHKVGKDVTIIVLGTFQVEECEFTETAKLVVFPEGKVMGKKLNITNPSESSLYNAGNIELTTLIVNGNSFYNCGFVKTSFYQCTSEGGVFVNFGTFESEQINSVNTDLYIGCYTSLGSVSEFSNCYIADGATLNVAKSFLTGASSLIYLGKNSVLNVGDMKSNGAKFYAPTSSRAYIKFGTVTQWPYSGGEIVGYYMIDPGDYFVLEGDSKTNPWSIEAKFKYYALGIKNSQDTQSIPGQYADLATLSITPPTSGECSARVTINGQSNEDTLNAAIYGFEDLGSVGDYDFNDIVVKISHVRGEATAQVELLAAGGTLPVAVKYGSEVLWENVHEAFGVSNDVMVNTGRGSTVAIPEAKVIQVDMNAEFADMPLSIVVTGNDGSVTNIERLQLGNAPQRLCVPATWKWPKEGISVSDAYNIDEHAFGDWAGLFPHAEDWYKHPSAGKVYE